MLDVVDRAYDDGQSVVLDLDVGTSAEPFSLESEDELVARYLPRIRRLARAMAKRLPPHVPLDDLISAGMMGLLDAIRRYDPRRCDRFEPYADRRIRGAILDELRSNDTLSRDLRTKYRRREEAIARLQSRHGRKPGSDEVARELGLDLEEYNRMVEKMQSSTTTSIEGLTRDGAGAQAFEDAGIPDPFQVAAALEVRKLLARAIDTLPARLKLVAGMYYQQGKKLNEIGVLLGVTEARACQLRGEAVRRLRKILANWDVTDDVL